MDMQDRRIRLPRIRNFGDDSIPMHAQASHSRSQYDNSEEDYSMSDIQLTAKRLQAKYEHSRVLKRNHFKEDIDTTDWDYGDDVEPSFDEEPQVPKQSMQNLKTNSRDNLKAFLNGVNAQSERRGGPNPNVRSKRLNLSEQKDPRLTADFANMAPGELQRSIMAIEEKKLANRAYYANKSHIVSNDGYGDTEPTIPIRILQDSLLEDSFAARTPPFDVSSQVNPPTALEHRNVEYKRHDLSVLPEIQEREKSTQEFSTDATPKVVAHEPRDDSRRYKSAPRGSIKPTKNFLIPLAETPAQEEVEPKDRSKSAQKPEKVITQRVIRKPKPAEKKPVEVPVPVIPTKKPGVPRFVHPEKKKNSVIQVVNNSDIIEGAVEKVWPVVHRRDGTGTVRNLSEQKNPSSSVMSQGADNKVKIKENRNASVEMGRAKKSTSENYMIEKVEYMFILHDKGNLESDITQQNNLIKKQIVQFREMLQNLSAKAEGKKKNLPPGKLGWLMEEVKASKQAYDALNEEYKKLQAQSNKANNSDYILTLEKDIQKVREAKKREEREKRNMELLDKKELYTNSSKSKVSSKSHGMSDADVINRVNLMQEARNRLKRQHSQLAAKNVKAEETKTEQAENLKRLEEKYSKLLTQSIGPGHGWTAADMPKLEEAKRNAEKAEELNKKIGILNKAMAQQERYQEGVLEVLKKEVECETKFLEQNTRELDRKQYALDLLNSDIQKEVQESPIFNEIKERAEALADEKNNDRNDSEERPWNRALKGNEVDFVIAELKKREARKLTKQLSSKESSRSPEERSSDKKSKERTPLSKKSPPESDYEEEDSLNEERTFRKNNKPKVKEEVKKPKNKEPEEPKPLQPKPPVPKFSKPKKPEIKVTSPKEQKEKESRRNSNGSVIEPDSLNNSPVRQLTDKIKESLLEIEKKTNEIPIQANLVTESEEIKREDLRKKVEEALKPKKEVQPQVKEEVKTPKRVNQVKEVERLRESKEMKEKRESKEIKDIKPAEKVKEELPVEIKKPQEVKEVTKAKVKEEEPRVVKEVKEEIPFEIKKPQEVKEFTKPMEMKIKKEVKEEIQEDIPELKEAKLIPKKEENKFKEPEVIQKPKESKHDFEINEDIKEDGEEKSALTLKPQLFKSRRTDNKPLGNPLDLKMKDNTSDMFSIKPNNAIPESKELVMPGSSNNRTLVLETNNARRPMDKMLGSNSPNGYESDSKELVMPSLLSNKGAQNAEGLSLPEKSPEKSGNINSEPLELPIAISGVSRRNRFGQAPRAMGEPQQESLPSFLDQKPKANQDNSNLNLDFLKQSSQSPDPGNRVRGDALDISAKKDNIEANPSLVSPFKAPEDKPIGRRRQIGGIQEEKTPQKKDDLDDIFGFDKKETVKEEPEKDQGIFDKPAEKVGGFGLGFGMGEEKKNIGGFGFGGGQVSNVNNINAGDDIARGAQARNRLARLKKGDDAQKPEEDIASLNVENNKGSLLESGRKDITKTVDPFAKYDDISSMNIEAKGKDLFGNRDNKPMAFGRGEEKKDNKNDLGAFLDAQFESKPEENIGNARRMRMNQKGPSANVKEKEPGFAVKAQTKENKFFGDIDLEDF